MEQWQRPPEAPYFLPATFSECAWSWHLRFCPPPAPVDAAEDASGGFPQLAEGLLLPSSLPLPLASTDLER